MAGNTSGKRFAQDFNKIDEIKDNDALMVQDSGDGVVKYATPSQILSYIVENTDYADIDKHYPKLTAGFADNLVGRGEATTEEFSYRPTAGGLSIESGAARIKAIKGNSVVWNQLVNNLRVSSNTTSVTVTDNGDGSFTLNGTVPENTYFQFGCDAISYIQGHKIYITSYGDVNVTTTQIVSSVTGNIIEGRIVTVAGDETLLGFRQNLYAGITYNNIVIRPSIFDLTQMFGVGNEPTTIEEFYQRMPIGIDTDAYNSGEIIDMKVNAIETVGFNQWDEVAESGFISYTGVNQNATIYMRSANYIPVIPNTDYYPRLEDYRSLGALVFRVFFYDKEKNFISYVTKYANWDGTQNIFKTPQNALYMRFTFQRSIDNYHNDICINLSHTGYKNGTYQPYETFTRNLPIISKYFPNGMRRAGNASDEIRFNPTTQKWEAVQNVGVRAYIASDASDASVTTDGTNTNYPLTTPIVTEITEDNINFDYDVEDFGTEEAIANVPSAPFHADIIYQLNAVDRIRQNTLSIEELRTLVVNLQTQLTALQNE